MPLDNQHDSGCPGSCEQFVNLLAPVLELMQMPKYLKVEMVFPGNVRQTVYLEPTPQSVQAHGQNGKIAIMVCGLPEVRVSIESPRQQLHVLAQPGAVPAQTPSSHNSQSQAHCSTDHVASQVCAVPPQQISEFRSHKRQKTSLTCSACVSPVQQEEEKQQTQPMIQMEVATRGESSQTLETDESSVYTASPRLAMSAKAAIAASLSQINSPISTCTTPNMAHLPLVAYPIPPPPAPFVPVLPAHLTVEGDAVPGGSITDEIFCNHCNKTFPTKANYTRHVKQVVNKIKKYICGRCGSGHTQRSNCVRHMEKKSCNESSNPMKCSRCPFRCHSQTHMDVHQCAEDYIVISEDDARESPATPSTAAASQPNSETRPSSSPNNAHKRKLPDFSQPISSNAPEWPYPTNTNASYHSSSHTVVSSMSDDCDRHSLLSSNSFVQQFRNLNHTH